MNIPSRFWSSATILLGVLIALSAVFIIKELKSIVYVGANPNTTNTINVEGTGHAVGIPDVATFSFTVNETAKTVAEAQTAATTKTNAALKAIRDAGVADKDISTDSYSIDPHYEYNGGVCMVNYCPPSKQVLTGYDVSQTIQIKVRDLSKAGSIFALIGSEGVENVNGLSFSIDDPASVQAQARGQAIADAQSKADQLAKQLGVTLVRIVSFTEDSGSAPRPIMYAMDAKATSQGSAPVAPEVPAGEQKVTDTVQITYEIR